MKKLRLLLLPLIATLVVACGGSGGGSDAAPQQTVAALQVHKQGAGSGNVVSSPAGIDCGTTCDSAYRVGTAVTLNAAPVSGSSFSGWAGSGTDCTGTGACTVTMETAKTVTATFSQPQAAQYNLSLSVAGQGAVTSSAGSINCSGDCAASFASGASVPLSATPASGYTFSGWSGSGISCPGTGTCTVVMTADRSVTATFTAVVPQYTLTVTGAGATGSVSSSPAGITCPADCTQPYDAGSVVTLTATPASGYQFSGWSNACTGTNTCVVTMSAARTAAASFTAVPANQFALNLSVSGSGTVTSSPAGINCPSTCSTTYNSGTVVTLTATPATGYKFSKWTGGSCAAVTGPCSVTMSAVTSVSAEFLPVTYSLAVSKTGTGTVTSSPAGIACGATCSYGFNAGTSVSLSAVPAAGFAFTGWSNNSACTGTGTCTVSMSAAASVTANFTAIYALTVTNGANGAVSSSPAGISCSSGSTCNANFNTGTSVTLTATPATGYALSAWGGACSGSSATCTVAMTQARSVSTTYAVSTPTDTTPPTVLSKTPTSSATNVGINTAVTVTFSEAVNCATVTTSSFAVGTVPGAVSCTGSTAVFTPSTALAYSTAYPVTLSAAIKDLAGNALSATGASWSFTTATAPATGTSFSFLAYGDSRAGTTCDANAIHIGLVQKMAAEPSTAFVFHLGDMIAGMDTTTNWLQKGTVCTTATNHGSFKEIIAPLQNKTPAAGLPTYFFPVVGNHDDGWGDGWYPDKFGNGFCDVFTPSSYVPNHTQSHAYFADWTSSNVPHYSDAQYYSLMCAKTKNDVYSQYMYYSFDYMNSHFVVMRLDTDYYDLMECSTSSCTDPNNYDQLYYKHQLDWLRYDLAQASARSGIQNIFVFTHAPLLTTADNHAANVSWPLLQKEFTKYKAKMVFSGHNHNYERSYPVVLTGSTPVRDDVNGTIYTVSGGGGSFSDGFRGTSALSAVQKGGESSHHYLRIDVNGGTISVKAIALDGTVLDSYTR